MLKKHSHVSATLSPTNPNINHTNTQFLRTELSSSMPKQKTTRDYCPWQRKHISNRSLANFSTVAAQWTPPCSQPSVQLHQPNLHPPRKTYHASNMVCVGHSDVSYLSEPKVQSRTGSHFFMSSDTKDPQNNG